MYLMQIFVPSTQNLFDKSMIIIKISILPWAKINDTRNIMNGRNSMRNHVMEHLLRTCYAPIALLRTCYAPITLLRTCYAPITHLLRAYYAPITILRTYYAPVMCLLRNYYAPINILRTYYSPVTRL